jgi:hypothetical protein
MNEPDHQQHELGPEPAPTDVAAGYEVSDVNIRGLVMFLVGLIVSMAVVVFAIAGFFFFLDARVEKLDPPRPPLADLRPKTVPAPQLQESPARDMQTLLVQQEAALGETKWIDKEQDVVQIPIERAMQLVVERGLPDWPRVKDEVEKQSQPPLGSNSQGTEERR